MSQLDSFLPIINLAEFADESRRLLGYRQFVAGGASVFLGLVLGLGTNLWRVQRGQAADLLTPVIRAVAFTVLLIAYTPICAGVISTVMNFGDTGSGHGNMEDVFTARAYAFEKWRAQQEGSFFSPASLSVWAGEFCVWLLYIAIESWVVFLKAAQAFTLACIVLWGPLLLGLSSIHPSLWMLGLGWFWSMVEVSAWSFTMDILLIAYSKSGIQQVPESFSVGHELTYAFVMLSLLMAVAGITSMLVRGTSAAIMSAGFSNALPMASAIKQSKMFQGATNWTIGQTRAGARRASGAMRSKVGRSKT